MSREASPQKPKRMETGSLFDLGDSSSTSSPETSQGVGAAGTGGASRGKAAIDPAAAASKLFARIALNRPVRREFTYAVPLDMEQQVQPGSRVSVSFARRRSVGVVVELTALCDVPLARLLPILEVLDEEPVVGEDLLQLTRWMADHYASAWGETLAAVLPAALKRASTGGRRVSYVRAVESVEAGALEELAKSAPKQHRLLRFLMELGEGIELRRVLRRLNLSDSPARTLERAGHVVIELKEAKAAAEPDSLARKRTAPDKLSEAQVAALQPITAALEAGTPATFLLAGVTGSGKTEVYLRAVQHALSRGRAGIMLVPEIALTPQTVAWFRSRLGEVCVLHSGMSDSQRLESWRLLRRGEVRVVVGARSAVFAPLADLGVIVVDEEHEPSFKQETVPRYHARDVAVERCRRAGAICILGSATPALESWREAGEGRYQLLSLPDRVGGGSPPLVHVVDMSGERDNGKVPLFSRLLRNYLDETLAAGEQAILFLNRRGFIPVLWCPGCEGSVRCSQCDVSLTYHRQIRRLVCHSCCEERELPIACPVCTRPGLRFLGSGSEGVESHLRELYPEARVRRMDADTMRRREDYEATLSAFEKHEVDVLVGTQMIAKGLDFPRVTLVGIISADAALHMPDFRASERTFQLIAQVAGRAGRSELPGRVVVQTRSPKEAAIRFGARADYEGFAAQESKLRAEAGYPPHGRLMRVLFEDENADRLEASSAQFAKLLRAELAPSLQVLGPAPAPFAQLRGRHRRQLLLKSKLEDPGFVDAVRWLADNAASQCKSTIKLDVDPMSLL